MLLAVDPGVRGCGASIWWPDKGLHVACYVANLPPTSSTNAYWSMADAALERLGHHKFSEVAIEFPQTYRGRAAKGDANDLLQVAAVVGALCARFGRQSKITLYRPAEWKGQTPKSISASRTLSKLSEEEKARIRMPAKSLQHNVLDAIGIGLKHLGR